MAACRPFLKCVRFTLTALCSRVLGLHVVLADAQQHHDGPDPLPQRHRERPGPAAQRRHARVGHPPRPRLPAADAQAAQLLHAHARQVACVPLERQTRAPAAFLADDTTRWPQTWAALRRSTRPARGASIPTSGTWAAQRTTSGTMSRSTAAQASTLLSRRPAPPPLPTALEGSTAQGSSGLARPKSSGARPPARAFSCRSS